MSGRRVAEWPEFEPTRQLDRLTRRGVDFVVIGAYAAVLHGSARFTRDLDITYSTDKANLEVLAHALVDLKATLRGVEEEVPFMPDADTLRRTELLTLATTAGPLDLIAAPPGAARYGSLRRRADRFDIGKTAVLVASIEDLIGMKRASGRPKDLVDIDELEAIRELR